MIMFHSLLVTFPPCVLLCFLCDVLQFHLGSHLKVVQGSGPCGKIFNFVLTRIFILVYTVAGIVFWREVWYVLDLLLMTVQRLDGPDKTFQIGFYCFTFLVSLLLRCFLFYSVLSIIFYLHRGSILASNAAVMGSNLSSAKFFSLYCLVSEQY